MSQNVCSEASTALNRAARRRAERAAALRPRLISIEDACGYVGCGRSKFYDDWLPRVRTVKLERRNLVDLESLDQLIDKLLYSPEASLAGE